MYDPNISIANNQLPRATISHGINYENGVVCAPTGPNGTIVALRCKEREKELGIPNRAACRLGFQDICISAHLEEHNRSRIALGDEPPFGVAIKPSVVFEVACGEIQKSPSSSPGYAIRFPRLVAVRIDKSAGGTTP